MTVKELAELLTALAEQDKRIADGDIYIKEVTSKGATLYGPAISKEYERSEEFVISEQYCILPFAKPRDNTATTLKEKMEL